MHTDTRGRVRFTVNHVRYEINKKGELRTYRRGYLFTNSERAQPVDMQPLIRGGMGQLYRAVNTVRKNGTL